MKREILGPWLSYVVLAAFVCACGDDATTPQPDAALDAGSVADGGLDGGAVDDTNAADAGTPDAGSGDAIEDSAVDAGDPPDGELDTTADTTPAPEDADTLEDIFEPDTTEPTDISGDTTDTADGTTLPQPCSPVLSLKPAVTQILTYDLLTFVGTGGTGAHRFELTQNNSGAILNTYTGAYLSGDKPGVTDKVRLYDLGCEGEATATVILVNEMIVKPLAPKVTFGTQFKFTVLEGSGKFAFKILTNFSGATLNPKSGLYKAGTKAGDDVIEITDTVTGETTTATVSVAKDAAIQASPAQLVVPLGGTAKINIVGGSGHFNVTASGGIIGVTDGDVVTGKKAGKVMAKVTDAFTGKSVTVGVTVSAAVERVLSAAGDGIAVSHVRSVPDLNGDGLPEVVVSNAEGDVSANNSGAVFVYTSTKNGLNKTPSQVLGGMTRDSYYGHGISVGDVNGDGRADLVVGAPQEDAGGTDTGAVYIHLGLKSGKFEDKASTILIAPNTYDHLGRSVTVCDVNGDGKQDVIAGAMYAEDRNAKPIVYSTGGVYVWLRHQDGYLAKPDQFLPATVPDGKGGWKSVSNMRMGWDISGADVDGDGACDIAVGALHHKQVQSNDGMVLLYMGQKAGDKGFGGLTWKPVKAWHGAEPGEKGSQFGRALALGDLDGDGKAELMVGQNYYRGKPAITARGAVRVFDLKKVTHKEATKLEDSSAATWTVMGPKSYDRYAARLVSGDVNGDGISDIVAFHQDGEIAGSPNATGLVGVYYGKKGSLPDKTASLMLPGLKSSDWFGLGLAPWADINGDGVKEVIAFAGLDDTLGYNLGRPYIASSKKGEKPTPLDYPAKPSGARFAYAVKFVGDLNNDGFPDLAVGAPFEAATKESDAKSNAGTRSGAVYIYKGTATGIDTSKPAWRSAGFYGHSPHDYHGWAITGGGDFNNDGQPDLMVMARSEDRPTSFGSGFVKGTKCSGGKRDNAAGVYIYYGKKNAWPSPTPNAVAYGPQAYDYAESVATGMDVNGDGFDDMVIGSIYWDMTGAANAGGWGVFFGKKASTEAGIEVHCQPAYTYVSNKGNDYLGRSVAPLGDLDKDGCDEFAVGGDAIDLGSSNQGAVHIVYGWGAKCASTSPRHILLLGGSSNVRAGYALDGGHDVDGDKINDLLVGGFGYSNGSATVGTVFVVTGSYLKTLKPTAIKAGVAPTTTAPMIDPASKAKLTATGVTHNGQFGWSVSFIPGLEKDGRAGVLVGAPKSDNHAAGPVGGAEVFRWTKSGASAGLSVDPWQSFVGESFHLNSSTGSRVTAAKTKSGAPIAVVGGAFCTPKNSKQLEQGAYYPFSVAKP